MVEAHCLEEGGRVVLGTRIRNASQLVQLSKLQYTHDEGVDPDKLLEEHDANADVCSPPAAALETVCPGSDLQLESARLCAVLQMRVSLGVDLLMQGDFGTNVEPLELHSFIDGGQLAQLSKAVQSLLISPFGSQPPWAERQEEYSKAQDKTRNNLEQER